MPKEYLRDFVVKLECLWVENQLVKMRLANESNSKKQGSLEDPVALK
jgi:hypothetical protein